MTFLLVKHLHISAAILSIVFFAVRAWWSVTGSGKLQLRIVKVLPHIIDTVLLVCGIILTVMMGGLQTWIVTKIIALVFYIGVGTVAIKRGRTASSRAVAALIAIAIFFYIVGVALSHNPLSWLA
jgi:uncharacterized membrane protein SirB2